MESEKQTGYYAMAASLPATARNWSVRTESGDWVLDNGVSRKTAEALAVDLNAGRKRFVGTRVR